MVGEFRGEVDFGVGGEKGVDFEVEVGKRVLML